MSPIIGYIRNLTVVSKQMFQDPFQIETSRCLSSSKPLELYNQSSLDDFLHRYAETAGATSPGSSPLKSTHIIPFASEKYNISPNPKDYIITSTCILPSDLPNRNKVAFPLSTLSAFSPEFGCLTYETFRGKPLFVEHNNSDHTQAKGIILDAGIRRMDNMQGNLWKVNILLAFDRTRDQEVANTLLTSTEPAFSMGCYTTEYRCSICNASTQNKMFPSCEHIEPTAPSFKIYHIGNENRLAHWNVGEGAVFFETSLVKDGAFVGAVSPGLLIK